jgi:hypothetical protein
MTCVLEKMLTVCALRENQALNRLVQSRAALIRAEDLKRRKEQELAVFRRWRRDEERRLFDELRGQPVAVKDVDLFNATVLTLRQDQADRTRQVEAAAGRVVEAQWELENARQQYAEAYRRKVKLEEHQDMRLEIERLQTEKIAENEMEEACRHNLPR